MYERGVGARIMEEKMEEGVFAAIDGNIITLV